MREINQTPHFLDASKIIIIEENLKKMFATAFKLNGSALA